MRAAPLARALPLPPVAIALAIVSTVAAGCGPSWPEVDNPRWMNSVGSPRVRKVRDLGTRVPPQPGQALQGESDGVASPGEYLLIEGAGFGKSPAVTVDGKAAEVVARTVGAGIVARVPPAVGVGPRPVEVAVGDAKSAAPFPLRRLAVTLHEGALRAFAIDGEAATPVGAPLPLPGGRALALSSDGGYAYVVAGSRLLVIDLGAAGGPKQVATRDLRVPATLLLGATRAPRVVAFSDGAVQIFDTQDPRAPAPYQATPLPPETKGATRADLDPDGNRVAAIVPEGNRVVVVDIAKPTRPRLLGDVGVLPEARVPLVRDVRFAPEGDLVRVLSGDGPASLSVGTQPTRLSLVKVEHPEGAPEGEVQATPWLTAQLAAAWAPMRLETLRMPPLASGATIRLPPEKAPVRFTSVLGALLAGKAAQGAEPLQGALDQGDATGEGLRVVEPRLLLGAAAGLPNAVVESLVAVGVRAEGGKREWGLAVITLSKPPSFHFTALGESPARDVTPPLATGELVVQP